MYTVGVSISSPSPSTASALIASGDREGEEETFVVPGYPVSATPGFMRGHGTYYREEELVSSLAGTVQQFNRLIKVKPVKSRYNGEVGDVVVGRVVDVQQKRWKINTNSRLDSVLQLSSVNLPGGELRRKSVEDELMMRDYLKEGDLISAEIQQVPSYLIRRRKSHFHSLPCGAATIIGCNGFIWICPELREDADGGYNQDLDEVIPLETRSVMARIAAVCKLLAAHFVAIYDTTIMNAYEMSSKYTVYDLQKPEISMEVATNTIRITKAEAMETQ